VLLPFLAALVWAAMIVIATWPLLLGVQARLGGRREPAVAVLTVALLSLWWPPSGSASHHRRQRGPPGRAGPVGGAGELPPPPAWVRGCRSSGAPGRGVGRGGQTPNVGRPGGPQPPRPSAGSPPRPAARRLRGGQRSSPW
jgi:hypothetical protein